MSAKSFQQAKNKNSFVANLLLMHSDAATPDQYIAELPGEKKEAMEMLRNILKKNLPVGFQEKMASGMLNYVVPHSLYPAGYHCNPKDPLPFIAIAAQKNFIALYHMGLYAMPEQLEWFQSEYPKHSKKKLDMGKSCIRFKKPADIPYELIEQLAKRITVKEWIDQYEKVLKK
jgi:uncharacterized protein YdhG (YjbR/CyaY superfamily)